jgi:hypothetical protein
MEQNTIPQSKPTRQQAVDQLLAQLPTMARKALQKLWKELFTREPSPALRRETLIPILAYRIQEQAFGGLQASTARKLRELAEERAVDAKPLQSSLRPKPGTRYIREYDGKLHEVTVLDIGYEYGGTIYHSLTEIAKTITGTKWSGPAFFGQRRSRKEAA